MPVNFPVGSSGDLRFASNQGRGAEGRARTGVRYPSPFFDIGHTYLPPSYKSLLRWCRYYYMTNPTINAAVTKMAAYPITDLHYDTESIGLKHIWDDLLMRKLGWRAFIYGAGLDYFTYGNAFLGISFPFRKHLICPRCSKSTHIKDMDYRFRGFKYEATCTKCHYNGEFTVYDRYVRATDDLRLMRWNPEDIDIDYNSYNGKKRILYNIPVHLKNDIRLGKRSVIEDIPDIYIRAVEKNKALVLSKVYHFCRQTIAQDGRNMGWGLSMILPVLKDTYYLQMLRKAQEMIAQEHIVPLRVIFPSANGATSDPYSTVNLSDWVGKVEQEVETWKLDPNHIPIFPLPIGHETIGGDGRALMLSQEMRMVEETIIAGMGVPVEFVKGGVSFGGTALSMHILKNQFEGYRRFVLEVLQSFFIPEIAHYMGWPTVNIRLKRFHMSDDLQRASLSFQLNQAAKISDKTMLEELNYNVEEETEIIRRESAAQLQNMGFQQAQQAHMQGEAQRIQQRYMVAAQNEMQGLQPPELANGGQPVGVQSTLGTQVPQQFGQEMLDRQEVAHQMATQLSKMPESEMYTNLAKLQPYPEIHAAVMTALNDMRGRPSSAAKPLPEQKPPRRGPADSPI